MPGNARGVAIAREAYVNKSATTAAADPRRLAYAARIVRAGAASGRLELADYVRELVDAAPPLTPQQRAELSALLRPLDAPAVAVVRHDARAVSPR